MIQKLAILFFSVSLISIVPKTVEKLITQKYLDSNSNSNSNSISNIQYNEWKNTYQENRKQEELRYLAFGTSVTQGAELTYPRNAYIHLLSRVARNLAIRGSDSSYPSMCTETMIQDSVYDVIIIEYDRRRFESLEVLVKRLRLRFPDAMIIITCMWNLQDFGIKRDDKTFQLREILAEADSTTSKLVTPKALEYVMNLQNIEIFYTPALKNKDESINDIALQYKAHVYKWEHEGKARDLLQQRFASFADPVHLNDEGHAHVANDLKNIINKYKPRKSDRVGSWENIVGEDFCSSWFETGKLETHRGKPIIKFHTSQMRLFNKASGKYAIELDQGSNIVSIINPFNGPRKLYLIYMSSYPNRLYPKLTAFIKDQSQNVTLIDPIASGYNYPVHVQDTQQIGLIKPGKNMIRLKSSGSAVKLFRLVGFAITNGEFKPSNLYFRPEILETEEVTKT